MDYEAIGELEIYVLPAKIEKEIKPFEYSNAVEYIITQEDISDQELADIAVEKARETGANALVNFKIGKFPVSHNSSDIFYIVTGFCIKRK